MSRTPPGPRGSLLLGSATEIRRDPLAVYRAIAHDYGDVVRIRFVIWTTYMLFHPDHVRHVLQEKHANYSKDVFTYRVLRPMLGRGLIINDGEAWLHQRRLMQPAFNRQRLLGQGGVITAACNEMLQRWEDFAGSGRQVDVAAEMLQLTLVIAGQVLFRVDLHQLAGGAGAAFQAGNELLADYVYRPVPPFALPTPRSLRLRAARRVLDSLVLGIIAERRRTNEDTGDLMSVLLSARDEETGEGMNDRQLRDEVMTLLWAGHETTAALLAWACYLLSQHDEAYRHVRAEAEAAHALTTEALPRLEYTRMFLEETMRLYPPGWSFGRKAIERDEISGYEIPAGSLVWVSPWVTHRHPDVWEHPDEFDPERFRPDRVTARPRLAHFPFGSGPRMCIGAFLAMMEAQLALASIAQRFRLRLAPGANVEPEAHLSLRPKHGLPMVIERA